MSERASVVLLLVLAACTRLAPPDAAPRPTERVHILARVPHEFDIEVEGNRGLRPTLKTLGGPLEWMRGDTVRMQVWRATTPDGQPWNPPVGARTTVVLDGSTHLLVPEVDPKKTTLVFAAIVSLAAVTFLSLFALIASTTT